MTALEQRILEDAVANLGVHEEAGPNRGKYVDQYLAAAGLKPGQPWCVAFLLFRVLAALKALNLRLSVAFPRTGSSSVLFAWLKRNGLTLEKPRPGCLCIVRGGRTGHEHSCLVERVDLAAGLVHTIDGNWGDRLCRTAHRIAECDFGQLPPALAVAAAVREAA